MFYYVKETIKLETGRTFAVLLFGLASVFFSLGFIPELMGLWPIAGFLTIMTMWILFVPMLITIGLFIFAIIKFVEIYKLRGGEKPLLNKKQQTIISIIDYFFLLSYFCLIVLTIFMYFNYSSNPTTPTIFIMKILVVANLLYYFILRNVVCSKLKKIQPYSFNRITLSQTGILIFALWVIYYLQLLNVIDTHTYYLFLDNIDTVNLIFNISFALLYLYLIISLFVFNKENKQDKKFYLIIVILISSIFVFALVYSTIFFKEDFIRSLLDVEDDFYGVKISFNILLLNLPIIISYLGISIPTLILVHKKSNSNKNYILYS